MGRILLREDIEPCSDETVMRNPDMAQFHLWHAQAQRDCGNISDKEMAKVEAVASIPAFRSRVLWNPFTGEFRNVEIANFYKSGDYLRIDNEGRITRMLGE